MFDILFRKQNIKASKQWTSTFDKNKVHRVSLLKWEEHCVECAVPYCYDNCLLYKAREDRRCVRLVNGLQRDYTYKGFFSYGINCVFRKWSKLETVVSPTMLNPLQMRIVEIIDNSFCYILLLLSRLFSFLSGRYILLRGYVFYKTKFFSWLDINRKKCTPDYLWIECDNLETKTIPLLVQTYTPDKILYSEIYNLTNGKNTFEIAYTALNIQDAKQVRLLVSPLVENDVKIAFSWLELVQLKPQKESIDNKRPADKIKCVAWDLDNTLWKGVLIEDGIDNIKLHATAVNTIKKLDEKGILNTIISKNNYDEAMEALNKFGLCEYFIYPAINWGQKSENLKLVAKKINIGIDTFAFIDDNIRERAEVASSLPMVRVYADTDIDTLLDKPEFDVSVTEMSSKRRLSYLSEMKREELQGSFTDNYDDYIRSLQMELSVSFIDNDVLKNRCYELLLRSNQLNLSTNRYSEEEYETLLKDKSVLCLAFFCKDKFGDYGNIGFMSIKMCTGEALITDLVISCRIAKKKVEEAMIYAVKTLLIEKGITLLKANLIKTKKNSPIEDVFNSLPFKILYKVDQKINFQIDDLNTLQNPQLIRISYKNDFVS